MPVFAKVRIKPGAKCFQDFKFFTWPPSDYEDGKNVIGVHDDTVFVAQKKVTSEQKVEWTCRAEGAGDSDKYGNGPIIVYEGDMEFLTPMLSYDPSKEERGINVW